MRSYLGPGWQSWGWIQIADSQDYTVAVLIARPLVEAP